ncbi:Hypothetical protein NTJ_09655 [Nesidiocoris tenuis]|uniref:Uncharacterized protein n=1 Tax=Nesidiocoris tenuis TaxID=355587 RepID=A0ABN7B108_9HEMI|nr:Hypothetical protein NTJ_09655 [Nesidiocoris tenuis]
MNFFFARWVQLFRLDTSLKLLLNPKLTKGRGDIQSRKPLLEGGNSFHLCHLLASPATFVQRVQLQALFRMWETDTECQCGLTCFPHLCHSHVQE